MSVCKPFASKSFSIVFSGLPLPLVIGLLHLVDLPLTTESMDLLHTSPNHLRKDPTIFSMIGTTPNLSLMLSFIILSQH